MHGRIDTHRHLIRIFAGDLGVHIKKVTVFLFYHFLAQAVYGSSVRVMVTVLIAFYFAISFNSRGEIQVHRLLGGTYAIAGVTSFLGGTGGYVAGHQVTERGVTALQVVIPFVFRNIRGFPVVILLFGHPDTTIVT